MATVSFFLIFDNLEVKEYDGYASAIPICYLVPCKRDSGGVCGDRGGRTRPLYDKDEPVGESLRQLHASLERDTSLSQEA